MRFPKLSQFFRRSKSDTALIAASKPSIPPVKTRSRRPVSSSFIDQLVAVDDSPPHSQTLSAILAGVAIEPIVLPKSSKPVVPPATRVDAITVASSSPPRAPVNTSVPHPLETTLKTRVRKLEVALRLQTDENKRIHSLEKALEAERVALQKSREANASLIANVSKLEAAVMQARGELYTVLNQQLRFSTGGESDRNVALIRENDRLRKFTSLIISCGAYNSVLERVSLQVDQESDPEEAMVDAIKEAMKDSRSVWRRLLEPLVGPRSPEDYLAQTNCTLKARRESRDWQKKTNFWKGVAREDERHASTVTPSVSQLSDIVDAVPLDRKAIVDAMLDKLREERLPLMVESKAVVTDRTVAADKMETELAQPAVPLQQITLVTDVSQPDISQPGLATIVESVSESRPDSANETNSSTDHDILSSSSSGSHPSSLSSCTLHPNSTSSGMPIATLAPLASITFRESHSIKSVSSRRNSVKYSRGLTSSTSSSSQDSRASKRSNRKVKILAASRSVSQKGFDLFLNLIDPSYFPWFGPDCPGASETAEELASAVSAALKVETLLLADANVEDTAPVKADSAPQAPTSIEIIQPALSHSSNLSGPAAAMPNVHATAATSPRKKENVAVTPSPSRLVAPNSDVLRSPVSSPDAKKSKLPVLKFASMPRTIRRFSISRPVLVDTTNAAATLSTTVGAVTKGATGGIKGASSATHGDQTGGANQRKARHTGRNRLQMMSPRTKSKYNAGRST